MKVEKKLFFLLPAFLISALFLSSAQAKNNFNNGNGQINQEQNQIQLRLTVSPSATGNQIQTRTQNQGEDSSLRIRTQEEGTGSGEGLQKRSQKALENMSEVAKYVQQLLQTRTSGGIGEQVREVAREQNQTQKQIEEELKKLDSKSKLARLLTGTDHGAIKNIKALLVKNRVRINQLEKLQNKLTNQADLKTIKETIRAIIEENASLQERIGSEEQSRSLLGWLFKFFNR